MSYPATRTTLLNLLINHLKLEIRHRYYYTLLLKLVGLLFHQLKFSVWPSGQNRRKSSLKECVFINSAKNTVPYYQRYTPTVYFFGYFAHWERTQFKTQNIISVFYNFPIALLINKVHHH